MRVFTSSIRLTTTKPKGEIDITGQVEALVAESEIEEGMALIATGHTTAAIHLSNADRDLEEDLHDFLDERIPDKPDYKHNKGEYGKNAAAHLKSVMIGNSVTIPVSRGRASLGQWQAVYFSEFDGPRNRLVSVKIIGE